MPPSRPSQLTPTTQTCEIFKSGSTYNTGTNRCDIDPTITCTDNNNYTYDSTTKMCKKKSDYQGRPNMEPNYSCPQNFQLNTNLKMCQSRPDIDISTFCMKSQAYRDSCTSK
jgi:hypothetical protein